VRRAVGTALPVAHVESLAAQGLERGRRQCLLFGHWRQDAGKALGEHGLAGAGRANHEHAVSAGGGDFECPFGWRLALDLCQVRKGRRGRRWRIGGAPQNLAPGEMRAHLQQCGRRIDQRVAHQRCFGCALNRQHEGAAGAMRVVGHGQRAPDGTQFAGQCKLPREFILAEPVGGNLRGGRENTERNRQIEAAAFLGQVRGREIDGDAADGKFETAVEQGGAHPVLALFHFDLGQTDDGEIRQPVGEMNLYGDRRRFHADQRPAI